MTSFKKKLKLGLKRLTGRELWLRPRNPPGLVTLGDWSFLPDLLSSRSVVYSFGIGDDIHFDCEVAARFGCEVHAFDPTVNLEMMSRRINHSLDLTLHRTAVGNENTQLTLYQRLRKNGEPSDMYTIDPLSGAGKETLTVPALTVASITQSLQHQTLALAKFDIEGAEYTAIHRMLDDNIHPQQLLVEFHHRFAGYHLSDTQQLIDRLLQTGYQLTSVSDTGRELGFTKRPESNPPPAQPPAHQVLSQGSDSA